jgi:3-hydroxyisobutyrate dehydrogenase
MIAFLGMGLLGSNFVRALRRRDEAVKVWNRNPERARALLSTGASVASGPADAVRGASRVHLALSDDRAVDEVLELARPGLEPEVIIIDHTTTSPSGARERVQRWAERGVAFVHAPVFMGPQNALESTGVMLVSGDRSLYERVSDELSKMTGKLVYMGLAPERAAAFKLLGNSFLMFLTAGFADYLALAKGLGVAPKDAASLFQFFNPGAAVPARLERLLAADYGNPSWELAMARKDARLMLEAAAEGGATMNVLPAIAQLMDSFIERGHAHDDWTVIAKDALQSKG